MGRAKAAAAAFVESVLLVTTRSSLLVL